MRCLPGLAGVKADPSAHASSVAVACMHMCIDSVVVASLFAGAKFTSSWTLSVLARLASAATS